MTETVTVPKDDFEQMKRELQTLRETQLYTRLMEFEKNIVVGKKFFRKDLGF